MGTLNKKIVIIYQLFISRFINLLRLVLNSLRTIGLRYVGHVYLLCEVALSCCGRTWVTIAEIAGSKSPALMKERQKIRRSKGHGITNKNKI